MSKMKPASKPKPKGAPKKKRAATRAKRTPTRRVTRPRPTPSPSPHVMTPGMQMPTASPSPSPGHVMTPGMQMPSQPQTQEIKRPRREVIPAGPILRLEDLEAMAIQKNPTLAQAEASIQAAEGRRRQAGMFPNPIAGYFLEEFAFRSPGETAEQGVFIEQTIPLGGKLSKARRVFAREKDQAVILAEAQRLRVTNSIRVLYYETLGAQRLVELRDDLSQLAREAVEITRELYNVGQADRPDQLEIEIEAERSEIDFLRAQNDWLRSWRTLAAMVGSPELSPARLAGSPEDELVPLNEAQLQETLLSQSPETKVALAGVERAHAVLASARAQRIPAEAELAIAERDLQRLQLVLRSRFAASFREYRNAQQMIERYRTQVVPRARQAYEMYLSSFRQMAAAYPQVLIAQRTLFQVEVEYARALVQLRQRAVGLRGFLLEGGLDAIGKPGESGDPTEGFKLRSASEATGDSDKP
ncbi:MAG: TolC family protein [Acidobacteria bacterium]|nr:TolC family protein [Acidobacteriota bacterium]